MKPLASPTRNNDDFIVSEEFLGLHCLSAIDAQSIADVVADVMKDAFLQFLLPLVKLRGQN